jgi:hypothetical protein
MALGGHKHASDFASMLLYGALSFAGDVAVGMNTTETCFAAAMVIFSLGQRGNMGLIQFRNVSANTATCLPVRTRLWLFLVTISLRGW